MDNLFTKSLIINNITGQRLNTAYFSIFLPAGELTEDGLATFAVNSFFSDRSGIIFPDRTNKCHQ
jgi:hypothetical protein